MTYRTYLKCFLPTLMKEDQSIHPLRYFNRRFDTVVDAIEHIQSWRHKHQWGERELEFVQQHLSIVEVNMVYEGGKPDKATNQAFDMNGNIITPDSTWRYIIHFDDVDAPEMMDVDVEELLGEVVEKRFPSVKAAISTVRELIEDYDLPEDHIEATTFIVGVRSSPSGSLFGEVTTEELTNWYFDLYQNRVLSLGFQSSIWL